MDGVICVSVMFKNIYENVSNIEKKKKKSVPGDRFYIVYIINN